MVPAKLEGMAFGQDVTIDGVINHTLYLANDNDFVPGVAGDNQFFVFGFTDGDLAAVRPGAVFVQQTTSLLPEPTTTLLSLAALGALAALKRRH
jgi:hypothetical protein